MIIGVPKEIKTRENRVGLVPGGVEQLKKAGHRILVEANAGAGIGVTDEMYISAGAEMINSRDEIWKKSEMIVKVKEPIPEEYPLMQKNQILYTYLHLAAVPELAKALLAKEVSAIAYETIEDQQGGLPLLKPMSEVAGRMAIQVGAKCLEKNAGGKGLLLGGVPGVRRARVTILGAGVVGINAAKMAVGLGAQVTILDINPNRLGYLDDIFGSKISTLVSNPETIASAVSQSDLVVGAVLLTGAKAPILVTEKMVESMENGSVIVDVAIDQGGSVATIQPTHHDQPTYLKHGVVHYGVTNMPGAVPLTSTYALTNATLPYALTIAKHGVEKACLDNPGLKKGLNSFKGFITHEAVALACDLPYKPF